MPLRAALVLLLLLAACAPKYSGLAKQPPTTPPSVPVVFVPGVTGVELRDSRTGEVVWGEGRNLLGPDDDGSRLALGPQDTLEPAGPIDQISVFGIHKPIYGPLRELLVRAGYVPEKTLFFFGYDWRRDLRESAGRLGRELEEIRRKQGGERLEVDLVCQSSGAHLCRYLAKYELPPTLAVRRLVLVGASNGGSLRILRELDRGRRYVPLIGRFMSPEVLFTFPSLFQDLPSIAAICSWTRRDGLSTWICGTLKAGASTTGPSRAGTRSSGAFFPMRGVFKNLCGRILPASAIPGSMSWEARTSRRRTAPSWCGMERNGTPFLPAMPGWAGGPLSKRWPRRRETSTPP